VCEKCLLAADADHTRAARLRVMSLFQIDASCVCRPDAFGTKFVFQNVNLGMPAPAGDEEGGGRKNPRVTFVPCVDSWGGDVSQHANSLRHASTYRYVNPSRRQNSPEHSLLMMMMMMMMAINQRTHHTSDL
jgi:hypothetical protein